MRLCEVFFVSVKFIKKVNVFVSVFTLTNPDRPDRLSGFQKKSFFIMSVKRISFISILLAGALLCSCLKEGTGPVQPSGADAAESSSADSLVRVKVLLVDDSDGQPMTRISGELYPLQEKAKAMIEYVVFKNDGTVFAHACATSDQVDGWTSFLTFHMRRSTTYRIQLFINGSEEDGHVYSDGFTPTNVSGHSSFYVTSFDLYECHSNRLPMFGDLTFTTSADASQEVVISVQRLVSRVRVGTVTNSMTAGQMAGRTFTLKKIYLTNIPLNGIIAGDSQLITSNKNWQYTVYNAMGLHSASTGTIEEYDELTLQDGINAVLAAGASHGSGYYFYTIPNVCTAAADTHASTWAVRCTRLVLECTLGSTTYYYPITIPAMSRNVSYNYNTITIKGVGALSPEVENPGALEYTFSTSTDSWETPININETI